MTATLGLLDVIAMVWQDAPVYAHDGLLIVSGHHPALGSGHFGFRSPRGLERRLSGARRPADAELILREELDLPVELRFAAT